VPFISDITHLQNRALLFIDGLYTLNRYKLIFDDIYHDNDNDDVYCIDGIDAIDDYKNDIDDDDDYNELYNNI
jgi:hypothetical protein